MADPRPRRRFGWALRLTLLPLVVFGIARFVVDMAQTPLGRAFVERSGLRARLERLIPLPQQVACQDMVRQQLIAPDTALFFDLDSPDPGPHVRDEGGGRYSVYGLVEARNVYGSKVRSPYACRRMTPDPPPNPKEIWRGIVEVQEATIRRKRLDSTTVYEAFVRALEDEVVP